MGLLITHLLTAALWITSVGPPIGESTDDHFVGTDLGRIEIAGSHAELAGTYLLRGGGADIWSTADAFYYVHRTVEGDFNISGRILRVENVNPWTKAGFVIRESLEPSAVNVGLFVTPEAVLSMQRRSRGGAESESMKREGIPAPVDIRLARRGDTIFSFYRVDDEGWRMHERLEVDLPERVYVGLGVTSHEVGRQALAEFSDVVIEGDVAQLPTAGERGTLHVTSAELELWRSRAASGPYRSPGDAGLNTPGDWDRIVRAANRFLEDPDEERIGEGYFDRDRSGCVADHAGNDPPNDMSLDLRDAAFVYLVTGREVYRDAVKRELLAQASEPEVDFANSALWCPGTIGSGHPGFRTATWLNRYLFAYDYLGRGEFSEAERARLDRWFHDAAHFWMGEVDMVVEKNFLDRERGDYTLTSFAVQSQEQHGEGAITHYGGWYVGPLARWTYNNRFAALARYAGITGLYLDDEDVVERAKRYFEEWLMFGVYPDNTPGEFQRWTDRFPDGGWGYAASETGEAVIFADHLARRGDPSLYEFVTSEGAFNTAGGDKSLLGVIRLIVQHMDGTLERYASWRESDVGNPARRIDHVNRETGWHSNYEILMMPANLYYRDPLFFAAYTRTAPGIDPLPPSPPQKGSQPIWTGQAGMYPGVMLMFGRTEHLVSPYPLPH